jgi:hypothetical protein
MHFSPSFFCWAKPMPSGTRSLGFSNSRMRPSPRFGNAFYDGLIHSAREHIDAAAGGSFFTVSIEEAHKLVEKMAAN